MSDRLPLILGSGSPARRQMLKDAGLSFAVESSRVDEAKLADALSRHTACAPAADIAEALAEAKAIDVSSRNAHALVIGSDQVLALGEALVTKAEHRDDARRTLKALCGQTHALHSAVALAKDSVIVWQHVETAHLTMRDFSDTWLEDYLDMAGEALTLCVGAYKLEGVGIQLFEKIEGDYFTILGMPLLPLLAELRRRKVIES